MLMAIRNDGTAFSLAINLPPQFRQQILTIEKSTNQQTSKHTCHHSQSGDLAFSPIVYRIFLVDLPVDKRDKHT